MIPGTRENEKEQQSAPSTRAKRKNGRQKYSRYEPNLRKNFKSRRRKRTQNDNPFEEGIRRGVEALCNGKPKGGVITI